MTVWTWLCAAVVVLTPGLLAGLMLYGLNDVYATPASRRRDQ